MQERGDRLKFFDVKHKKAPTLAQITLGLIDSKDDSKYPANVVDWISDGIKAENDQWVSVYGPVSNLLNFCRSRLRSELSKLPKKPTVKQQLSISRMRARLSKQVKDFLHLANSFLPPLEDDDLNPIEDESINTPGEESVEPEDALEDALEGEFGYEGEEEVENQSIPPETVVLPLPSNITSVKQQMGMDSLISLERELRKGQANDALEGLRIGLANKSLLLLTDVNQSKSTKQSLRAWDGVRNAQSQILIHARCYQRAWKAINCLGTPDDLSVYQKLEEKDLVTVKDITSAKRYGQGSDCLAWFWRIGPTKDALTGEWMEECKFNFFISGFIRLKRLIYLVYRVNWLRAKARVDRWEEERTLVKHEMHWTTIWFQNQANLWGERSKREDLTLPLGHKSYAIKQEKLWNTFYKKASEKFILYI